MKRTKIALLIIIAMSFSAIPFGLFTFVIAEPSPQLPDYEPLDLGYLIRAMEPTMDNIKPMSSESKSSGLRTSAVGAGKYWLTLDSVEGLYFFSLFYLRAESANTEIWVQNDLDRSFPEGDSRSVEITDKQVEYLLNEFDTTIYPNDANYFGTPDYHNGSYSLLEAWGNVPLGYYQDNAKNVVLVSNFIDDSYYDPTYPNYIAGFYSPSFEAYMDRNIISIDAYDWVNRVGPDGSRPNLYESVIAHEYQHLIHDDWFPTDATYMNEACSLFAEPLCGYELDLGQVNWFLATPDNSLTYWGEQGDENILADYGSSFLWALYLTDHYGFYFLQKYVQANWVIDPDFPMESKARITELLPKRVDFYKVYHDWRIANLIHSDNPGCGKYNYNLDELRAYTGNENQVINWEELTPTEVLKVNGMVNKWTSAEKKFGETISLEDPPDAPNGWPTGYSKLAPFATDYIQFNSLNGISMVQFLGDQIAEYGWYYDETTGMWSTGQDNLLDALIYSDPYVVNPDDVLTINTYWDIENEWDFGFVQVSTDGGNTWQSLANEYTTMDYDPSAHPDIIANLPGLTGWSAEIFQDDDYYIFHDITFDLSAYVGQEVIFGFRYMTDWYTTYQGWLINDAYVGDLHLALTPIYPEAKFMVTVVQRLESRHSVTYSVYDMFMFNCFGSDNGIDLSYLSKSEDYILIVSTIMDNGYTDYQFKAHSWGMHCGWFKIEM
jgi:immune inhibitor A